MSTSQQNQGCVLYRQGEFNCSLSYSNVIVTRRSESVRQSGRYDFYCGDSLPVSFCVQVRIPPVPPVH